MRNPILSHDSTNLKNAKEERREERRKKKKKKEERRKRNFPYIGGDKSFTHRAYLPGVIIKRGLFFRFVPMPSG